MRLPPTPSPQAQAIITSCRLHSDELSVPSHCHGLTGPTAPFTCAIQTGFSLVSQHQGGPTSHPFSTLYVAPFFFNATRNDSPLLTRYKTIQSLHKSSAEPSGLSVPVSPHLCLILHSSLAKLLGVTTPTMLLLTSSHFPVLFSPPVTLRPGAIGPGE